MLDELLEIIHEKSSDTTDQSQALASFNFGLHS